MNKPVIYERIIKRFLDFTLALTLLIVCSPILLLLFVLVGVKFGFPVVFKQKRPGLNEKIFVLYKLRTMSSETDENGELLPDILRLTKFGKFLRASSLDELPSLLNILKGDLSFVGPRPLALQYLPFYYEHERKRHKTRPGLTGYAQVSGRNSLDWEEKFKFDLFYVDRISFIFDLKILFKTVLVVIKKNNIGVRGVDAPIDFDLYRGQQKKEEK